MICPQIRTNTSTGRVRNASLKLKKIEAFRHLRNAQLRIQHEKLMEEQRAKKIEKLAESSRQHQALVLERRRMRKENILKYGLKDSQKEKEARRQAKLAELTKQLKDAYTELYKIRKGRRVFQTINKHILRK